MLSKLPFSCDYLEGCHPAILERLSNTNYQSCDGYGYDPFTLAARDKILQACQAEDGEVFLLSGGTQANLIVISGLLRSYEGVLAPSTGHINAHEGGAIENGGHKVIGLPQTLGKVKAEDVENYLLNWNNDANHDHMVKPGMLYISQPTEYGTLYSLAELQHLSYICRQYSIRLYCDGARLAYSLASRNNDVSLADLARYCDVFYIGGTKCGALCGEAVVIREKNLIPHFFTIIKQHGGILAKGRLLGIQFDELFTDDLYLRIGSSALDYAEIITECLKDNHYQLLFETPTNQIFVIMENHQLQKLGEYVSYSYWEPYDDEHTVIRLATSWATRAADVQQLCTLLEELQNS